MRTLILSAACWAATVAASAWATVELRRSPAVWDHFDVVKPGLLYRSGELRPGQLAAAVARYGIRTVVNLQLPDEGGDAERELARRLGVDFLSLPMPGDGFGREDQFRAVLEALDDPGRRPVLVHCARGTCRTGAAVALYRYERDGWTIGDVTAEMVRQTYRDGFLPGYVYAMARARPLQGPRRPAIALDRNRPGAPPAADGPESETESIPPAAEFPDLDAIEAGAAPSMPAAEPGH